jgi:hypothetical protein
MSVKRIILGTVAGAVLIAAGLLFASGLPQIAVYIVFEALFPSTISWDGKTAFAKCEGAIADPRWWPKSPTKACEAMHMCANETQLSSTQMEQLSVAIRKTEGCPAL